MVEIEENYKDYEAPACARKAINRIIRYTPERYLSGLHLINLTNTKTLNRKERRQKTISRKRKVALNKCSGWYVQKWKNDPAYIELIIDSIYAGFPAWVLKIGFISDIMLASVFYHELGHHIHKTQFPEYAEREDVADKWERRLSKRYFWKRYWHFMVVIWPLKPLFDYLLKCYDRKKN